MKTINQKLFLATFSLTSTFIFGSLLGQTILPILNDPIEYNTQSSQLNPKDFESSEIKNNLIFNEGSPNYQYQNLITSDDVNDNNLYNRKSVLSTKSIQTVRNEKYYFNFIKSPGSQTYHIMITPVDPALAADLSSDTQLANLKFETNYTELNGSALWIKNRLVMIGSVETVVETVVKTDVVLSAYVQNMETGMLTLENSITASETENQSLFALQNLTTTLINRWPYRDPVPQMYSYNTFANPIYLSPVEDSFYSPSNSSFSLLAWSSSYNVSDLQAGGSAPSPVLITYNRDSEIGFRISPSFNFELELNESLIMPINPKAASQETPLYFTRAQFLANRILAMTPIIDENGTLVIYMHSHGGVAEKEGFLFVSKILVSPSKMIVVEIISDVIEVESVTFGANISSDNSLRDPMNYLPYGIFAQGGVDETDNNSLALNLFWFASADAIFNSLGVGTNIVIKKSQMTAPEAMQIQFFERNGIIYRNFLVPEQIYYPPERNLNNGIKIGLRFRGVGTNNFISRLGFLNWRQPWNPATWSYEAAIYGTTIVDGYGATPATAGVISVYGKDLYIVDVMATVWDGIYTAVGIYQGQDRLENPQTGAEPVSPAVRKGVQTLTKDLNKSSTTTIFNTQIPFNISLDPNLFPNLSPTSLGSEVIDTIIKTRSKDFPAFFAELIISSLNYNFDEDLILQGNLINPYINGVQLIENELLPFELKIQHTPTANEILNPVKINSSNFKTQLPSTVETPINEAFAPNRLPIDVAGIIGTATSDFIQVLPSIAPFVSQFKAVPDDFLGSLNIDYQITSANGQKIDNSITINGFWGYVYIIPIVLGAILIVGGAVLLTLFLTKQKHKKELSSSISKGFNLYKLNSSKINKNNKIPPKQSPKPSTNPPIAPIKSQPSSVNTSPQVPFKKPSPPTFPIKKT